jgi:ParB family transcriptional regulator, chromosome partitioning protein
MIAQRIESIPIAEIRVINPRARNKHTFNGIVNNIGTVGLKKPITVSRRQREADGTQYDLAWGQGRLEAIKALGGTHIPAIITDASLKERYLMSLVENIARKHPPHSALVREVHRLKEQGYKNATIAEKLGLGKTYMDGIVRLLRCGEERLIGQVVAGAVPLNVAITIATAGSAAVRKALSDAYEKGDLRGRKLVAVQRMIGRRAVRAKSPSGDSVPEVPARDLVVEYERQTQRQRNLLKRAAVVHERLALVSSALKRLVADERLRRLLRAEGLDSMPEQLASRLA